MWWNEPIVVALFIFRISCWVPLPQNLTPKPKQQVVWGNSKTRLGKWCYPWGWYPSCLTPPSSPLKRGYSQQIPTQYKVYMSGWFLRGPYFWAFPTIFTLGPAFCLWKPVDSRKVNYSFAWENSWWLYICPLLVSSPELMPGRPQKFVYTIQNTKKSTKGPGESVFVKFAVNLCRNGQGYTVTPPENPRCFHLKTKKHFGKETKIWTKPSSFWASKCFSPLGRLATPII